ncbi:MULTISPECIES: hypothetical protein [Xanthomonas]|uniref:hypothetical protein n=1 Tax=Xanthomonas TaxID=338 RepID=UPI001C45DDCB|nr:MULTISPECIES: hypothetical protein [Xanthomonas]MBV6855912.1 hypothetical protein [Xanthomonas campestris pv. mirabilis]MBV6867898.1 hypothetical protein [Xanthomonas campestris pv. coriandri]MCE4330818.1 hypothetical protein [Xanthomonas campestris pv. coriandri]MEA9776918.1 hypothetical protein [Xanthomonas campestris pv. raphani]
MATKKGTKTGVKQVSARLSMENWRKVQTARIEAGITGQALLIDALNQWLKKNKHEPLAPQGEDEE